MKKLLSILISCSLVLLSSCTGEIALPEEAEELTLPASARSASLENSAFLLEVSETGFVSVTDKQSGNVYTSTPEAADEDEIASGVNMSRLKSEYFVTLVKSDGATAELNSFEASLSKDGVGVEQLENSVKVWYSYPDQKVMHSAEYSLEDDGLKVRLAFKDMAEQFGKISGDDWGFMNISVMPYFAASGSESTGYMVVPDGSGAIINHNNKKSGYAVYSQEIYGRDPALNLENKTLETKTAPFPVFGNVEGGKGYAAIIEQGAADAAIHAETSGAASSYNNVYAGFAVRRTDSVSRSVSNGYGGNNTLGHTAVSTNVPEDGAVEIKYILLGGEGLSYVNLAHAYRNSLIKGGVEPSAEGAPVYLGFTGGVSDTKYTLGIPHKTVVPVTDFESAAGIISDLRENGVSDIAVRLRGWQKGGLNTKVPKNSSAEGKLGGNKGISALMDSGARVFPEVELVNFYKGSSGLSLQSDCVFALSGSAAFVYEYMVNTGAKNLEEEPCRMLSPNKAAEAWQRFKKNSSFADVSLGSLGETVTSDFGGKNLMTRTQTAAVYGEIASGNEGGVMVSGGNSYTLAGASHIYGMESEATGYDLEDGSIPFYQIALHGLRSYSVTPINLTADTNRAMLKALETGSSLCYSISAGDISVIGNEAPYEYVRETILSQCAAALPVLEAVSGDEIVGHESVGEELYKTTFSSGAVVYVNYGPDAADIDGKVVEGKNFLFEEGAA